MKRKLAFAGSIGAIVGFGILALGACQVESAPPLDEPSGDATPSDEPSNDAIPSDVTPSDATPSDATPSDATPGDSFGGFDPRPQFCGGFGGIPCPSGYVCEDDPRDDCDPDRGGRDCGGICVPDHGDESCDVPGRQYVSHDPAACRARSYRCGRGLEPFFDPACGCGCEPARPRGVECGGNLCSPGQYCCNRSCGICAPLGGSCILIDCD